MENIYKNIKSIARKYVGPAIIGLSTIGAFGGCEKQYSEVSLPVSKEVIQINYQENQKELNELSGEYKRTQQKAKDNFNLSLVDKVFSRTEQSDLEKTIKKTHEISSKGKELTERSSKLGYETNDFDFSPDESLDNLYNLIHKNLYGFDYGTTELEKSLSEKGLDVRVEKKFSDPVEHLAFLFTFTTGLVYIWRFIHKRL